MEGSKEFFNFVVQAGSAASGLPEIVISSSIIIYVTLYILILGTGLSMWISKCYNKSIVISIIGSMLLMTWMYLYIQYVYTTTDLQDIEAQNNMFAIFLYLLVILAGVLSYGFYKQVTGKCGLFLGK